MPASTTIYQGALVSLNASGQAVNALGTLLFAGIATETKTSVGATTDKSFCVERNMVAQFPIAAATLADLGKQVYVGADNNTVQLAASASLAAKVGRIVGVISSTLVEVDMAYDAWNDAV